MVVSCMLQIILLGVIISFVMLLLFGMMAFVVTSEFRWHNFRVLEVELGKEKFQWQK